MKLDKDLRIMKHLDWSTTQHFRRRLLHSLARIVDAWHNGIALLSLANTRTSITSCLKSIMGIWRKGCEPQLHPMTGRSAEVGLPRPATNHKTERSA
jgi:hypothetical protein